MWFLFLFEAKSKFEALYKSILMTHKMKITTFVSCKDLSNLVFIEDIFVH